MLYNSDIGYDMRGRALNLDSATISRGNYFINMVRPKVFIRTVSELRNKVLQTEYKLGIL